MYNFWIAFEEVCPFWWIKIYFVNNLLFREKKMNQKKYYLKKIVEKEKKTQEWVILIKYQFWFFCWAY